MAQKKQSAAAVRDWGARRGKIRRVFPDRRNTVRLKRDRRHLFGRRKEDREKLASMEKQLCQALEQAEVFGSRDLRLAAALNELAVFYYTHSRYALAEPLQKRALAIREKTLEPTHPDLTHSLYDLARLYYAQGRYAATEPLMRRILAIQKKAHGSKHEGVAEALDNYAEVLTARGSHERAAKMAARAKAIRTRRN